MPLAFTLSGQKRRDELRRFRYALLERQLSNKTSAGITDFMRAIAH